VDVIAEAADGDSATATIIRDQPQLVFLDVQMPRRNGFDVLADIASEAMPEIVFVTAFDEHAVRAFEYNACDYLLKPFDERRLAIAVERSLARLAGASRASEQSVRALLLEMQLPAPTQLVVKVDGRHVFLDTESVDRLEVDGKETHVYVGKHVVVVREPVSSLERRLDPRTFLRVRRSTIVNRSRIREIQPWFRGEYIVLLHDGTKIISGRHYREPIRRLLRG
jgi:two-component system, LytTR family, response regulator